MQKIGFLYENADLSAVENGGISDFINKSKLKEQARLDAIKNKRHIGFSESADIQNRIDDMNRMYYEACNINTQKAFTDFLLETYMGALVIDDEFITENQIPIRNFFLDKLNERCNGDMVSFMDEVATKSIHLKELVEACKAKGKAKGKKFKEKCNEKDVVNSDIKIEEEFDKLLQEPDDDKLDVTLDSKEGAEVIKDKVISVLKDEEDANEKKKAILDDISAAVSLDESISLHHNDGMEHHSLFNSIMMYNYKNCMKQINEGAELGEYVILDESTNSVKVNMDYILCDTILEYTELELYNTLGIDIKSAKELREMADHYAHYKK